MEINKAVRLPITDEKFRLSITQRIQSCVRYGSISMLNRPLARARVYLRTKLRIMARYQTRRDIRSTKVLLVDMMEAAKDVLTMGANSELFQYTIAHDGRVIVWDTVKLE